jgi:mono/diheme cytochrome c family protein
MMRVLAAPILAISLVAATALAAAPDLGTEQQREAGKKLYGGNCAQCHGDKGDGQGIATPFVLPRPRDFTAGKFKIRTTPSGALPTDEDLRSIIRAGMPYTAMPAWPNFSDEQVKDLIYTIKSFAADFAKPERQVEPIQIPAPPSSSSDSIEKGKNLYAELGCARCHGELGRADGPSAPTLKDDWGNPIRPADLTRRWTFRGGPTRRDIFRAFSTGLNGTPMPSFADALSVEQRWDLVSYIYSLSPDDQAKYATVLSAKKIARQVDLAEGQKLFEDADEAYFPVLAQIMQPGRDFHPSCNGVTVRAVYNEEEIAFELRWNDMAAETTGKNGPDVAVPATEEQEEEKAAAAKPAAAEGGEGGWGEAEAAPAKAAPAQSEEGFWDEGGGAASGPKSEFSDAVAIQFPVEKPATIRKPYFIFGDKQAAVDIWFADLAKKEPTLYLGHGSDALEAVGPRELTAASHYEKGEWTVAFKRKLRSQGETTFEQGDFMPIAFSVWDGLNRERGNKRGLTNWWSLYLEPAEKQSPVGAMVKWAAGVFLLEVAFIGWARRRKGPRDLFSQREKVPGTVS